jgi:ABC-type polysaccharide transport system permease subunit
VTVLVASLGIALLLHEARHSNKWLARFYQSTLFFPYLFSYVIINYFVFALLNTSNGLVNHLLMSLGMPAINWYASPQYWPVILTLVNLWKNVDLWSIVYLAGIIAINPARSASSVKAPLLALLALLEAPSCDAEWSSSRSVFLIDPSRVPLAFHQWQAQ